MNEFARLSAVALRDLFIKREASPVEVARATLEAVHERNSALNAFITITEKEALEQARAAECRVLAGEPLPPLLGVPVSIKDVEPMAGVRYTRGSLATDTVAKEDALCVERLRAAGAVIIGKSNTAEFGFTTTTENRIAGACRNPRDLRLTPGGSSGGAAASVAAGLTPIAEGSDGGGSVRAPAAFCHVFGMKPTQGRVPRYRRGDLSWNVVATSSVGPIARTVEDAAIMLRCLAGPADGAELVMLNETAPPFERALTRGVRGLRVGVDVACCGAVDPIVAKEIKAAALTLQELGAHVDEVAFRPDPSDVIFEAFVDYFAARGYQSYGQLFDSPASRTLLTDYAADLLRRGKAQSAARHIECLNRIGYYRHYTEDFFTRFDLLLAPVTSVPPFPIGDTPTIPGEAWSEPRWRFFRTHLFNLTGNPAASVPAGFSPDDRPIAVQLVGRLGDEETVFAAAAAFETARPWSARVPA